MGRTGTYSLKLALEQLQFGPCYHMFELFQHPERLHYFLEAEKELPVNWDALLEGYHSAVDYPIARYWKQLYNYYPDARFIHTQRDPEQWYQSCVESIFWASKPSPGRILNLLVKMPFSAALRKRFPVLKYNGMMLDREFGKDLSDKKKVIQMYNEHNEDVLRTIPKNKLLLFQVKDGWGPLCEFLGVPAPATPFPKTNSREQFRQNVKQIASRKELVAEA